MRAQEEDENRSFPLIADTWKLHGDYHRVQHSRRRQLRPLGFLFADHWGIHRLMTVRPGTAVTSLSATDRHTPHHSRQQDGRQQPTATGGSARSWTTP